MSKLYYTISEVAEAIGVDQSLLLYWEKEFSSFIKSIENIKGVRFYRIGDVEIIEQIYFLVKTQGLTLSDAKPKIKQYKEEMVKTHEIIYSRVIRRIQEIKKITF